MLLDRLANAFQRAGNLPPPLALVLIDLDDFRRLNQTYGTAVADTVLEVIDERLGGTDSEVATRLGGDEFGVLLEGVSDVESARAAADRCLAIIAEPIDVDGVVVQVTASAGVALAGWESPDPTSLQRQARVALQKAKVGEPGHSEVFRLGADVVDATDPRLHAQLRDAIDHDGLTVHYLPVVDLTDEVVVGVEAFVRWPQRDRGILVAADILPIAAVSRLTVPLSLWVLEQVCRDLAAWQERSPLPPRFYASVNVAMPAFLRPDLVVETDRLLRDAGIDNDHLRLEVSEAELAQEFDRAKPQMEALRTLGVQVALDGYSAGRVPVNHLEQLPLTAIKLSTALLQRLGDDPATIEVVRNLQHLAGFLEIDLVAVGVEQDLQRSRLSGVGVRYAEGYGFTVPLDAEEVEHLLALGVAG